MAIPPERVLVFISIHSHWSYSCFVLPRLCCASIQRTLIGTGAPAQNWAGRTLPVRWLHSNRSDLILCFVPNTPHPAAYPEKERAQLSRPSHLLRRSSASQDATAAFIGVVGPGCTSALSPAAPLVSRPPVGCQLQLQLQL